MSNDLRRLKTVTLAPTKGSATLAKARAVFPVGLDSNFQTWGTNVPGEDMEEVLVDVHEMIRDGTFKMLFGSLGDPHQLVLSQGQIVEFCSKHSDSLRQEVGGTFFLFKVNGELLVARVFVYDRELQVDVNRFDRDVAWEADDRHRFVVQQTA